MKYRSTPPEDRTIVGGFWSDLLDLFHSAFKDNGGTDVLLKTVLENQIDLQDRIKFFLEQQAANSEQQLKELKLLNARLESRLDTTIQHGDL